MSCLMAMHKIFEVGGISTKNFAPRTFAAIRYRHILLLYVYVCVWDSEWDGHNRIIMQ